MDAGAFLERPSDDALTERERLLLSEAHHRTANAFQMIAGMLRRELSAVGGDPAAEALARADAQLHAFALLNDMLRPASTWHGDDTLCAAEYLTRLCEWLAAASLAPSGHRLVLRAEPPARVAEALCRVLGLITTELVLNCAKHAFGDRREGVVEVSLTPRWPEDGWELRVADNGRGFAAGTSESSRGLVYVERLATSVGGSFHRASGPAGSEIRLQLA